MLENELILPPIKLAKLKATTEHPTSKKLERVMELMEKIELVLEWSDKKLFVRDHEFGVSFEIVGLEDNKSIRDLPSLFQYKLIRDKNPNKYCKCEFCISHLNADK